MRPFFRQVNVPTTGYPHPGAKSSQRMILLRRQLVGMSLGVALTACAADLKSGPGGPVFQPLQLSLTPNSVDFIVPAGGQNTPSQTVTIGNAGPGTVNGLGIATILYEPVVGGWLAASIGGVTSAPAVLTLTVDVTGMAPGIYFAVVPVVSTVTGVNTRDVFVSVTVTPVPAIDASPDTVFINGTAGGANPTAQPVTISNSGTGSLTGMSVGTTVYDQSGSGWLGASLNQPTDPAILTLQANITGLASGSYSAMVPVLSNVAGTLQDTVTVVLTLTIVVTPPSIGLSPTTITMSANAGGANPPAQTAAVTNAGGGTLNNLSVGAITYTPPATQWMNASLDQATAPATLTLASNIATLSPGLYRALVRVQAPGASNTPRAVTVNLTIFAAPALQLSTQNVAFAGTTGQPNPSPQSITISNAGSGPLAGIAAAVTYGAGQPAGWLQVTQPGTATPTALILAPSVAGLPAGNYSASIVVSSTSPGIASRTINVTFGVASQTGFFNIIAGDGQTGLVDSLLPVVLRARVTDANQNPAPNVPVVWTVQNGGTLVNTTSVTNSIGEVTTRWQLGHFAGLHTARVSSAGLQTLTFQADAQLPQSGGSAHPNEPPSFVRFAEHNMSSLPSYPKTLGGLAGAWFGFPQNDPDLVIVNPDTSAPESPPLTIRTRFPSNLNGGSAPVNLGGWDAAGSGPAGQKSKVYISMWVKILGNDYENHPVGTKMGFIAYGEATTLAQNQGVFRLKGTGNQSINSSYKVEVHQQNHVNRVLVQQISGNIMTVGVWHHWEMVMELNTLGQADGILKWWVDGNLAMDYDDVQYITPGNLQRFHGYKWNPTWGGTGNRRTRDDFIAIDHIYISGIP